MPLETGLTVTVRVEVCVVLIVVVGAGVAAAATPALLFVSTTYLVWRTGLA
jgi:hypothetical protein